MFVLVVREVTHDRIVGPFASRARAAGYAVNHYGFNPLYTTWRWTVRPLCPKEK